MDIIPIFGTAIVNEPYWLYRLFYSIDYPVDTFVIVDNSDGTISNEINYLKKVPHKYIDKVEIISYPRNVGCAGAWNSIIKTYFDADGWLISNHDIMFYPNTLSTFLDTINKRDANIYFPKSPVYVDDNISFEFFYMRPSVVTNVGLFDENFYPGYGEDIDYTIRIKNQGEKYILVDDMQYLHGCSNYRDGGGSQTIKSSKCELFTNYITNCHNLNMSEYFVKKWGTPYIGYIEKYYSEIPNKFDIDFLRKKKYFKKNYKND